MNTSITELLDDAGLDQRKVRYVRHDNGCGIVQIPDRKKEPHLHSLEIGAPRIFTFNEPNVVIPLHFFPNDGLGRLFILRSGWITMWKENHGGGFDRIELRKKGSSFFVAPGCWLGMMSRRLNYFYWPCELLVASCSRIMHDNRIRWEPEAPRLFQNLHLQS